MRMTQPKTQIKQMQAALQALDELKIRFDRLMGVAPQEHPLFAKPFRFAEAPEEQITEEEPAADINNSEINYQVLSHPVPLPSYSGGMAALPETAPVVYSERIPQQAEQPVSAPKTGKLIAFVTLCSVLALLATGLILLTSGGKAGLFGYHCQNMMTNGMQDDIPQGSLVFIKKTDPNTIKIGDDIMYTRPGKDPVIHRVAAIMEDFDYTGARGFQTKGTQYALPDQDTVRAENIVGVAQSYIPGAGWVQENMVLIVFL